MQQHDTRPLAVFAFLILLLSVGMAQAQSDVRAAIEAANA
jgi:hypothetical protein